MSKTKNIFITGGVLSGLGKGVSAASIGRLLKARGYKVFVQKFDPYYNADPGTMSPYEHGEVYVTDDGAETDLDLGHYERFIGTKLTKASSFTQGRILREIIDEEREGKYGGSTIQVIPHVMNKIVEKIQLASKTSKADFVITEIGGTVGDIESNPFITALAEFHRLYKETSFFVHATFIPYLESSQEFKSKPTQHSIKELKLRGVFPNMLLLRANHVIDKPTVEKVAITSSLPYEAVFAVPNVDNIFKIPLLFEKENVATQITDYFKMPKRVSDLTDWTKYIKLIDMKKTKSVKIGMVGKYVEYEDAYKSIIEALKVSANYEKIDIEFKWIQSGNITKGNVASKLKGVDGVVILPGFGKRGFDGKVVTAEYTRNKDIPTFGICYGFQAMVIDQARRIGIEDATSSELDEKGTFVIDFIRGKGEGDDLGGTLRLGSSKTYIKEKTLAYKLYKSKEAFERHRHRYEANPSFVNVIQDSEFIFSGFDALNNFAEVCEVPKLKFYLGLQAHPEFNSNPLTDHPLFSGFVKAVKKDKYSK